MENINFKKDNVLICGKLDSSLKDKIFRENYTDGDTVYFFDSGFTGVEYYPENPDMNSPIRVRSDNLDGIRSILISVLMGGRTGLTLMINYSLKILEEAGLIGELREFCNSDNDCNLIMMLETEEVPSGFNFDHIISV